MISEAVLRADKLVKLTMSPKNIVALRYILVAACFSNFKLKAKFYKNFLKLDSHKLRDSFFQGCFKPWKKSMKPG